MNTVSLQELLQDPANLVKRVEAGEPLLVIRGNRAVLELRPAPAPLAHQRPFGLCAGDFVVPDDFDDPLPEEVIEGFEGPNWARGPH